jgi:SAM-dependent methyltransferase
VLDIGGGDSRLVDFLLDRALTCVTVLDISGAALARARERLGSRQSQVRWIEADVTGDWDVPPVDIWHDRALFHFLTDAADRKRYHASLRRSLRPGGTAIIGTFGPHGPEQCSSLPVVRYGPQALEAELGPPFRLEESAEEIHRTPLGSTQAFSYCRFTFG